MASYRFCRTDDWPLLAAAHAACFAPHFPGTPPLDVAALKRLVREIDLWASSAMVAQEGEGPIAVLLATKRPASSLVWCLGVHPEHLRRGHGRHLLTSLASKLAILGPPRLETELPAALPGALAFFEACGFSREAAWRDFALAAPLPAPNPSELVVPVTLEELVAHGVFDARVRRPWGRTIETLVKRGESIRGLAVASEARIEAHLLYEDDEATGERRLLRAGCAEPGHRELWLELLLRHGASALGPVVFERAAPEEVPFGLFERLGFVPGATTLGLAREVARG